MENVKFVRSEKEEGRVTLYFKICDTLAGFLRENTDYSEERLNVTLSPDNVFKYHISPSDDFDSLIPMVIETIEKIGNEGNDAHLYNSVITDNGKYRAPREMHELMHEKYGLFNLDDLSEDCDQQAANIEWWTAHFFLALADILFHVTDDEYKL